MRNISFALTTEQFLDGSKVLTRRLGWATLKAGERLMAIEKGQGIPKGGHVVRLGEIHVVGVRREPLDEITEEDVAREGFPEMTIAEFVRFFCKHNGCEPDALVTRIEFRRVD